MFLLWLLAGEWVVFAALRVHAPSSRTCFATITQPGDFVHVIGDAHVYLNHVDALRVQLAREPRPFPTLRIDRDVAEIDDFKFSDFVVEGYKPDKSIKMKMAV